MDSETNLHSSVHKSPTKGRKNGTRLSRRRDEEEHTGSSQVQTKEEKEFYDRIVRRTNDLFVKLNINTRPIQAFEELQKSASSMFVAIFETLFNVRLKNVIRKPRVVTDYIANAQLVMTALSESLPIDLSFLSGEAIYRGDPIQIHHMLSIFESLWEQLVESSVNEEINSEPELASLSQARPSPQSSPSKVRSRSMTPAPHLVGPVSEDPTQTLPRVFEREGDGSRLAEEDLIDSNENVDGRKTKTSKTISKPKGRSSSGGSTSTTQKKREHSKSIHQSSASFGSRRGNKPKTHRHKKQPEHFPKTKRNDPEGKQDQSDSNDENLVSLKERMYQRRMREKSLPTTPGYSSLQKAAQSAVALTKDDSSFNTAKHQTEVRSIQVLAQQYPTIYRTVWRQSAKYSMNENSASPSRRRPIPANPLASRMEKDLDRYKKAYKMMVKGLEADMRRDSVILKRNATLRNRGTALDERIENARTLLMEKKLKEMERSHQIRHTTKEEVLVKNLFRSALKLEHDHVLAKKQFENEKRQKLEEERVNRFESLKRYHLDREALLQEKMDEEKRDKMVSQQARNIALKQLERELRDEYRSKLDNMASEWKQREERDFLATEQNVSSVFDVLNEQMAKSFRSMR